MTDVQKGKEIFAREKRWGRRWAKGEVPLLPGVTVIWVSLVLGIPIT